MKRGGGRRYYRPDDIALLRGIRHLLYGEGYTIRGVQRLLRGQGVRFVQSVWQHTTLQPVLQQSESGSDQAGEHLDGAARAGAFAPLSRAGNEDSKGELHNDDSSVASRAAAAPAAGLSREGGQKLRAVLQELTECRRLLDEVLDERSSDDGLPQQNKLASG
jgi:DNA-binding transcriptional MerR regulator